MGDEADDIPTSKMSTGKRARSSTSAFSSSTSSSSSAALPGSASAAASSSKIGPSLGAADDEEDVDALPMSATMTMQMRSANSCLLVKKAGKVRGDTLMGLEVATSAVADSLYAAPPPVETVSRAPHDRLMVKLPVAMMDAIGQSNLGRLRRLVHENFDEQCVLQTIGMVQPLVGREAVHQFYVNLSDAYPDMVVVVRHNRVVVDPDGTKAIKYKFFTTSTTLRAADRPTTIAIGDNLDRTLMRKRDVARVRKLASKINASGGPYESTVHGTACMRLNEHGKVDTVVVEWKYLNVKTCQPMCDDDDADTPALISSVAAMTASSSASASSSFSSSSSASAAAWDLVTASAAAAAAAALPTVPSMASASSSFSSSSSSSKAVPRGMSVPEPVPMPMPVPMSSIFVSSSSSSFESSSGVSDTFIPVDYFLSEMDNIEDA